MIPKRWWVEKIGLTALYPPTDAGRVVLTNGVFDLVHPGHVYLLERAAVLAGQGGRLVVAIDTDQSARKLAKGPNRPLQSWDARAAVIAALACVDCVTPMGEVDEPGILTLEDIVQQIRPAILVKGGDYEEQSVRCGELLRAYGGRVMIVPRLPYYSSTGLVKRMMQTETYSIDRASRST